VRLGTTDVQYRLRRTARSRGIRVTVDPRHGLMVSVPAAGSGRREVETVAAVEAFLAERSAWVLRHLARLERERSAGRARAAAGVLPYRGQSHRVRVHPLPGPSRRSVVERVGGDDGDELVVRRAAGERRATRRLLVDWLRERAAEAIDAAVAQHALALGVRPSRIDLRDPRSRWGSASREGRLMFSWRLVLAPPDSLETVVVHELAHLRAFGHGPRFWDLVAARRPSHLADRAWLRRHSHALHAALDVDLEDRTGNGA
jgi:predicted metal-dependent hydrolase